MTEKEIKKLKQLLDAIESPEQSSELDQRILAEASQQIDNQTVTTSWFQSAASGAIAISLTVGLLFLFSQMILPEPAYETLMADVVENENTVQTKLKAEKLSSNDSAMLRVQKPSHDIASHNDLSERYSLPSSELLLGVIRFSKDRNQRLAEQEVEIALSEIGDFLNQGALESARERYHQLREFCDDCGLPESLEALAKLQTQFNFQG